MEIGNDICLIDSGATNTILRRKEYFTNLIMERSSISTVSGSINLIEGSGRAIVVLRGGTKFIINDALFSTKSKRNLLSFKDIRQNGYHVKTATENNMEYLYIVSNETCILERLPAVFSGLYYMSIRTLEVNVILNPKFNVAKEFIVWHDRLGHPGSIMMRRIIENSNGHKLKNQKILQANGFSCAASSLGKMVTRPSLAKVGTESPTFLERIQGDICGPIHPPCGPFRYFMVLIDASARWSHVSLLSTCNLAFARLLAQIIRL